MMGLPMTTMVPPVQPQASHIEALTRKDLKTASVLGSRRYNATSARTLRCSVSCSLQAAKVSPCRKSRIKLERDLKSIFLLGGTKTIKGSSLHVYLQHFTSAFLLVR